MKDKEKAREQPQSNGILLGPGDSESVPWDIKLEQRLHELQQDKHYLESILSHLYDDLIVIDKDYRITDVNKAVLSTTGHKHDQVIGRHCYEIFHGRHEPCEAHGLECSLQEVFQTGETRTCCHQHVYVDGSKVWVDLTLLPLKDASGNVIQVIKKMKQVKDFINEELALRESEERFNRAFENANIAMCLVDTDGRITKVNNRMCEILGYDQKELRGMTVNYIAHPEYKDADSSFIKRILSGEIDRAEFENKYIHKKGHTVIGQVVVSVVRDFTGNPLYSIWHVKDITQLKSMREEIKWKFRLDSVLASLYKPLINPFATITEMTIAILNQTRELTGSMHGYVSSIDPITGDNICHTLTEMMDKECKVAPEDQKIIFPRGEDGLYGGLWGYCLNTLEPFYTNSTETHPAFGGVPKGHIHIDRYLSVPVMLNQELVGQISLANKQTDYTERDLEAVCRIGEYYALAIQRRRAEKAVQNSEAFLKSILTTAPVGICLLNSRVFDWVSDQMNSMLGYCGDELIGKSARIAYVNDEEFERVERVTHVEIQQQGIGTAETRLKRKDGSVFNALVCSSSANPTDLSKGVIFTVLDITERTQAVEALLQRESDLRERSRQLEELNTALKVLLKRRDEDRLELEESLLTNVKELILPYLEKLKKSQLSHHQLNLLGSLESNIEEIVSPFTSTLSSKFINLTSSEIQIANLIKDGRSTKEIADLLYLSVNTILFHRYNLRRKLGLTGEKISLRSHLRSLQDW